MCMKRKLFFVGLAFFVAITVVAQKKPDAANGANYIHRAVKELTDVMVHDIYSPPVASRIYAYSTIAGYEAAIKGNDRYLSLAGQLRHLQPVPGPDKSGCSYPLAAVKAILSVGKTLVTSEERVALFEKALLQEMKAGGITDDVYEASVAYGQKVADHILAWAAKDNYSQTRSFAKYDLVDAAEDPGAWRPTPPAYMKAVEPHWGKMRTFLVDSAQQFKPLLPTPFSTDTASLFYKEAKDVKDIRQQLDGEKIEIAQFWDCNPFKMNINGHVMYASKKISPGGHWINITRLACKKVGADFIRSAEAYACLSVALADGFISCWDEKYRSKVIRPETYINQYIDGSWMPLLQTPPFPEYTSGHSVVSTASAIMLTKLFGDNFHFADSTEVEFDLPVRHFTSFRQAANEAAISRFYGGIHYMPSIVNGVAEGEKIGEYITQKLVTRREQAVAGKRK